MTVETGISAKGRISYYSDGSQTRLTAIVDELISGETCEFIKPNGDHKTFTGYSSKTRKEIAEFIKAEKVTVEPESEEKIHIAEQFKKSRAFADKLISVDRLSEEQADAVITAAFNSNRDNAAVKKIIDDFKAANFAQAQEVAKRLEEITATADAVSETPEIDASEYAISEDAFNFAVAYEIEEAEQAAFEARLIARTLADDELAARYEKAKSQVKRDRYSWYFKGKNRDEWECDDTKAAACLTRYGLPKMNFSIFYDAEVALVENAGYDESAFDLLPTVDKLNDTCSDIEKEFDEFDAEGCDLDDRFNRGKELANEFADKMRKYIPMITT
ncbi:MAG: hypothetical protein IJ685_03235 [Selenomonadaceae bacterium]|nr:hypothetical protein [Selenomonadaceae bacterium]